MQNYGLGTNQIIGITFGRETEDTIECVSRGHSVFTTQNTQGFNLASGEGNLCSHHSVQGIYIIPNSTPEISQTVWQTTWIPVLKYGTISTPRFAII